MPRQVPIRVSTLFRFASLFLAAGFSLSIEGAVTYLPGVANTDGRNGTHYSSDVKILNRGLAAGSVIFELIPASGEAPPPVWKTVQAGETLVTSNVLENLWGLSGMGTLKLSIDQPAVITGRTFNDADPSGTFGTALTPVAHDDLLESGDTGHAPWVSESPDSSTLFRTNLSVFLALAGSSVDIVLFDSTGREKGRTNVSGGPQTFQTSVSALVPEGLPLGRAEFRVLKGKAAAYVSVTDNFTGDGISVPAELPPLQKTRSVMNGVAFAAGKDGTFFRTDIRLFNLSDVTAIVTVTPLSIPGVKNPATMTLSPGEVREVTNAIGTLLNAPEGSMGSLLFTANEPVMVLGRTSNVRRDGTGGTYGAFQQGRDQQVFLTRGSTGTLIGLRQTSNRPGYRSNIGFLSGPDGAAVSLSLKSRTGTLLASNDSLTFSPLEWTQPSLALLFPVLTIPDDSTLEITPRSGEVDVYASVVDNATGDPVIDAAQAAKPFSCPVPEILSFEASPDTLKAGGNVTLSFTVSGADSLTGLPGAQPPAGSVTVEVSTSRVFQLSAANPCGTVTKTVSVMVGPPVIQLASPSSASPGELVTLRVTGLAKPANIGSVLVKFPDGINFRTEAYSKEDSSEIWFLVPFLPDATQASGYRAGTAALSIDVSGQSSNAVPFTISTLKFVGDSFGAFNTFLNNSFGPINTILTAGERVLEFRPGFATFSTAVRGYETLLRKIAADLTAAETTVTPVDIPSSEVPVPETVTVARGDLGVFLALWRNVQASSARLSSLLGWPGGSSTPCLGSRHPALGYCVSLKALDAGELFANTSMGPLRGIGFKGGGTITTGPASGLSVLFSSYNNALETARGACPVVSVWLEDIVINPDRTDVQGTAEVKAEAFLEPLVSQEALANHIGSRFTKRMTKKFTSGLSADLKQKWSAAASNILTQQTASIRNTVTNWLKIHGPVKSTAYRGQVGSCDLDMTFSRLSPGVYARLDETFEQGKDSFFIKGIKRGTEVFYLAPKPGSFLFVPAEADEVFTNPAPGLSSPVFTVPLRSGGTTGFSVSGIRLVRVFPDETTETFIVGTPRQAVTRRIPFKFSGSGAFAGNVIQISSEDDLTFTVKVNGLAPAQRLNEIFFDFAFLFRSPHGQMTLAGSLRESFLTASRAIDGVNRTTLFNNLRSVSVRETDSFQAEESYELFNNQRFIHSSVGQGFANLEYVFSPVVAP